MERREDSRFRENKREFKRDSKRDFKGKGLKPKTLSSKKSAAKSQLLKEKVEYKNLNLLQKFLSERGKIFPRRLSGISATDQRALTQAIKKARFLGLLSTGGIKK